MTDIKTQLTLQTWMSAAFPTGAFTCSHGMEQAIADNRICDAASCEDWISGIMQHGSGWNDAVLMTNAYLAFSAWCETGDIEETASAAWYDLKTSLSSINELALALCSGAERRRETTQLGDAFVRAVVSINPQTHSLTSLLDGDITLPVAMGAAGALCAIPAFQLIPASLQATSSNLVWISTRLIPLGQTQALQIINHLQPLVASLGTAALDSTLDDLGSCAALADLASIEHEHLSSRICIT